MREAAQSFRHPASCLITVGVDGRSIQGIHALVAKLTISTARHEAAVGEIEIEDRRESDGHWMAADSGLFAASNLISVSADFESHSVEIFRGYITKITPDYPASGGAARLKLEIMDQGAALNRHHMRRMWGEGDSGMPDLEILKTLVSDIGVVAEGDCGAGQSSRPQAQNATPIQFLYERAKASGYELYFTPGKVYFGPMRLGGDPQPTLLIYAGRRTNVISFQVEDDATRPDAVAYEVAPRDEGAQADVEELAPALPVLGSQSTAAEGSDVGTPSVWRVSKEGDETAEEVRARAQGLADAHSFKLKASGALDSTSYGHVLRVGRTVRVDGAGTRYGGLYYVDKVVHEFADQGYRQNFELIRNGRGEGPVPPPAGSVLRGVLGGDVL